MKANSTTLYLAGGVATIIGLGCIVLSLVLSAVTKPSRTIGFDVFTSIPLAGSLLVFVGPLIAFVAFVFEECELMRSHLRMLQGRCEQCGYDLRGNAANVPAACPECGARSVNPAR